MTEEGAKRILRDYRVVTGGFIDLREAIDIAIQSLEEIQQYRAIGTIEEFKALKEKAERFDRNITMFNSIGLEIRNKAIDEFTERLKAEHEGLITNLGKPYAITFEKIDEIAEEMKGGAIDG